MKRAKRSSSRNRPSVSKGKQKVDRLSELPDAVLCHILSFLPTQFSVATSILSRRWRLLWTEVPVLEFDDYGKCNRRDEYYFGHIVDKVLLLHSVENLNTFRLLHSSMDGYINCTDEQIETWITNVIARKVQNLELRFLVMLPQSVFTCKTLVDLRLFWVELLLPEAVCFPNLKNLDLIVVRYKTDEALPHLISGCPVLEKLVIDGFSDEDYMSEDLHCISISSPTIKWLKLEVELDSLDDYIGPDCRVEINAPALRYLQLKDFISKDISAHALTSLTEADIYLKNDEDDDGGYSGGNMLIEFIDKLCNVKHLTLSCNYSEFLDLEFSASTVRFHNLTQLDLSADYRFISKFLENASNLQVLIISQVYGDPKCWIEPQQVPACLSSHLTTIKIYSFNYAEHEFKMCGLWSMKKKKALTNWQRPQQIHGFDNQNDVLPIYIGDDRTDEDAFKVLRKANQGYGILVSPVPKESNDFFSLKDTTEVQVFLESLVRMASQQDTNTKKLEHDHI